MQIFITGATGLIGRWLIKNLLAKFYTITILTRRESYARHLFGHQVDYYNSLNKLRHLDRFDAVINLAGEPIVGKRWTWRQKKQLCQSRWTLTSKLAHLIQNSSSPPMFFISGSAVGYYGNQQATILTEQSKPRMSFTHSLCQRWEQLAWQANSRDTSVYLLRTGIILSDEGGMLPKIALPFHFGLGSIFGSGKQYLSWIHIDDVINAILFLLTNQPASGPYNICSPSPVTNKVFSQTLAHVLHRPNFFTLPSWLMQRIMGESSTMILDGQRAIPDKLIKADFQFKYPELTNALIDLLIVDSNLPFSHSLHK